MDHQRPKLQELPLVVVAKLYRQRSDDKYRNTTFVSYIISTFIIILGGGITYNSKACRSGAPVLDSLTRHSSYPKTDRRDEKYATACLHIPPIPQGRGGVTAV